MGSASARRSRQVLGLDAVERGRVLDWHARERRCRGGRPITCQTVGTNLQHTGSSFPVTVKPGGGEGWPRLRDAELVDAAARQAATARSALPARDLASVPAPERRPDALRADRALHDRLLRAAVDLRADRIFRNPGERAQRETGQLRARTLSVRQRASKRTALECPPLGCRRRLLVVPVRDCERDRPGNARRRSSGRRRNAGDHEDNDCHRKSHKNRVPTDAFLESTRWVAGRR